MENPLFDCGNDDIKEAVLELVLKAAISRQGEEDGWKPAHMQKARAAVCDAAHDLLEAYEELYNPGNRINVLQENEVLEAQSNLLNNMSNNNSNNNSSNSGNNSSNNNSSNNNSSNNNSSNNNNNYGNNSSNNNKSSNNSGSNKSKKNGNKNGGARRRRTMHRRRGRKN